MRLLLDTHILLWALAEPKKIPKQTRSAHAVHVARLPLHHRDPFDRLLVAQAILEPARLVTVDGPLRQYSDLVDIVTV
jgi:PIN domain nuclease of toxin-antitoxin system